ncbi:hypothetical protein K1T71_004554 [Dendrolimus kikuchii]|uniref:Uncharacterized protein n=1 Tax=Dendrolimus kikuchii TaxID=765133 RepID=A0ACC1D7R9_9NEOP|nr:hypothetical protein K1T71_004554 [Dendrolimus kikuchii]
MWRQFIITVTIAVAAAAIKVPIDRKDENTTDTVSVDKDSEEIQVKSTPIYYVSDDTEVDSYLIPPDPNKPHEKLPDTLVTPATYLLPPSPDKQSNYSFSPTEAGESDWLPITNIQSRLVSSELQPPRYQQEQIPIFFTNQNNFSDSMHSIRNTRMGKVYADPFVVPVPSGRLEPPPINALNEYLKYIELPPQEQGQLTLQPPLLTYRKKVAAEGPVLALSLRPPSVGPPTLKIPTKLYPKKYNSGFKPVPIPIAQFGEGLHDIPRAKPVKLIKPIESSEIDYTSPISAKKNYEYQEAEQKRKIKNVADSYQPFVPSDDTKENYDANISSEQDTSETNHRYPGRNIYSAPLRQAPQVTPQHDNKDPQAADDRTEFRMHGMKGPHSYQFGYDTGKGKNRQFRYEERDNDGQVKGHYGYMDKYGKLRIVNYSAHPEFGFHAEAPVDKE